MAYGIEWAKRAGAGARLVRLAGLALMLAPSIAFAAPLTFKELAMEIVEILDLATITLIVFALVAYFWGIAVNTAHFGEDNKGEKKKAFFIWGIIILFVMVSVWGIIQLIQNTLFSNSLYDPSTGKPTTGFCISFTKC